MSQADGSDSAVATGAPSASTQDALDLLHDDHRRIDEMLLDCERMAGGSASNHADRSGLISRLGALLIAHGQLEQQLFYPALREPAQEVEEMVAEHEAIKDFLHRLSDVDAPPASFDNCVKALAETVRAHIRKEELQCFSRARSSGLDLYALGTQLALRRAQLLGDQGVD